MFVDQARTGSSQSMTAWSHAVPEPAPAVVSNKQSGFRIWLGLHSFAQSQNCTACNCKLKPPTCTSLTALNPKPFRLQESFLTLSWGDFGGFGPLQGPSNF